MKKSSPVLSTEERSMASGGRLSQCRRLGKYLNFHDTSSFYVTNIFDRVDDRANICQ